MKKLKCNKEVQDKNNPKVFYKEGEIYPFEDDRAKEILEDKKNAKGKYFSEVKAEKPVKEAKAEKPEETK